MMNDRSESVSEQYRKESERKAMASHGYTGVSDAIWELSLKYSKEARERLSLADRIESLPEVIELGSEITVGMLVALLRKPVK